MAASRKLAALSAKALNEQVVRLNSIPGAGEWKLQSTGARSTLNVSYSFKSFAMTWRFLNSLVLPIQQLRHHPTITTTYNSVDFSLTTHDIGNSVSLLDLRLALIIAHQYRQMGLMVQRDPVSDRMSLTEANAIIHDLMLDSDRSEVDSESSRSNVKDNNSPDNVAEDSEKAR